MVQQGLNAAVHGVIPSSGSHAAILSRLLCAGTAVEKGTSCLPPSSPWNAIQSKQ